MAGAEMKAARPLRAEHARQRHLRLARRIPCVRRFETVVAVAARLARFAEIREQPHAPASRRFAQAEQRVELAGLHALVRVVGVGFVDHLALLHDVAETVGHPRVRRHAVAARAARFLVIAFDALRQVEVSDEAHVRFVDAHAERDRRAHHDPFLALKHLLMLLADFELHAGVIRQRAHALVPSATPPSLRPCDATGNRRRRRRSCRPASNARRG